MLPDRAPRPTLEAVAAHAGVSRATVSRVVNGGPGVRAEVRERVHNSVRVLGYAPNIAARSLVTRRTGAVGVVIAEPESRVFSDPFFSRQLRGISRELAAHDTQLLLMLQERAEDHDRISRYLTGGHVDGVLMFSLHGQGPPPGAEALAAGLPTVFGGRPGWPGAAEDPELVYVDADNRGGARLATEHLLGLGRRRPAVLTGPPDQTSAQDRLHGFHDALTAAGLARSEAPVADGGFTAEGGEHAMARLLEREPELDAVFAGSDLMAVGALRALRASGRRVPEDVAVAGFDDLDSASWADPPLTTVRQDVEGMGRIMARLVLRQIGGGAGDREEGTVSPVITEARLVVRESA
ncbi:MULTISPECIES: LacI family DNA-binding transcriptional regulator [unclassified Streptomyces]|uniref:LacI family DNA-binding transcriptional regulator n=1 Tax=unclassified Streptomyces TaxID=2593676 RepID=UPI002DDB761B|nr:MULTISPECIES: LacI family DNA-binding transcriptional regulator [unclassified Streptomyces]WSA95728.1 LacI family transcriptional regulator [Streptomyces sp. NBC_01795]WSS11645.1 LacI family transcriptional regulator [Streptomyces sp. NBC_01186]WSS40359.1 LacI family transcriptional regulator [Streptomyces sp. NBC_01187]